MSRSLWNFRRIVTVFSASKSHIANHFWSRCEQQAFNLKNTVSQAKNSVFVAGGWNQVSTSFISLASRLVNRMPWRQSF